MKREQTAVEWLVERLGNDLYIKDSSMSKQAITRAKQMEKKQLEESHKDGQHYANNFEVPHQTQAEQYYESKYGKDENKAENND